MRSHRSSSSASTSQRRAADVFGHDTLRNQVQPRAVHSTLKSTDSVSEATVGGRML
ncbi:hypothetical protein [Rudaea sp.]|uniref:hypothetical protein n=1 Tax=Rudaea sp. TaxID=2136325 RepID=UPI0039E3B8B4